MTRHHRQTNLASTFVPQAPTPGVILSPGATDLEKNLQATPDMEIGTTGLAQFSGLIFQEPLIELRGREGYKRYDEMRRNSPIVSALLLSFKNPIRSTSWTFSSEKDNDPRLDILNQAIDNMQRTLGDHIFEALSMLEFGYSVFEPLYEQKKGVWLWRDFSPRNQYTILRWLYREVPVNPADPNSIKMQKLVGLQQLAPPKFRMTSIPIERLVVYKLRAELDNPEGTSILRPAWIPYFYVKHFQQIEAIALERLGPGFPVIHLPPGATTDNNDSSDYGKAAKMVRNIRNDQQAGAVLPDLWTLDLLHSDAKMPDYNAAISRHTKDILTAALAQFLMLGQQGIGSLALSKDQTDFFTMSVNATADILAETFTHDMIPPLMALNGYDAEGLMLEHTPAQGETSVTVMADFLQKAGSFIHLTPDDEVWIRQLAGMPEKSVEEIQTIWDDEQAQQEVAAKALAEKMQQPAPEPNAPPSTKESTDQRLKADLYAAVAKDKVKRDQIERRIQGVVKRYQADLKKRVLKGVKK